MQIPLKPVQQKKTMLHNNLKTWEYPSALKPHRNHMEKQNFFKNYMPATWKVSWALWEQTHCTLHQLFPELPSPPVRDISWHSKKCLSWSPFPKLSKFCQYPPAPEEKMRVLKLDVGMLFVLQELWSYKNILVNMHKYGTLIATGFVSKSNLFCHKKEKKV